LLDEPFAALDPRTRARLDDELPEAIGMASSLLVTHDIAEALVVSDRVLVLGASGAITAEVEGLRRRTPSERRRALMSDDGLARQSRLFGALEEVGDA
jgi:ABC-type nitrate/sulfonate/bicarbonate transport system ATPase subunit